MSPHDGRVVSNFIMQALQDKDISIYGNGNQTRSFCYVSDMIEAMIMTMQTEDDFTGPVNIGNTNEHTIMALAEKIIALTGSKSEISYHPLPADDPIQRQPDITLAKKVLGWEPKVQWDEGLRNTIEYFRSLI